jgi:hypothetical protein
MITFSSWRFREILALHAKWTQLAASNPNTPRTAALIAQIATNWILENNLELGT